jgi:hypothetical protein
MSTHTQLVHIGPVSGFLYLFDKAGEGLGLHVHDHTDAHNVYVLYGSVRVYGEIPTMELSAGMELPLEWDKPHEILALEDNTMLLNRFLHGIPAKYASLPFDKRTGRFEDTLKNRIQY